MLSIEECREDGRLWNKFKEAFRTWISSNHCDFLSITDSEGKYPKAEKPAEIAKDSSDLAEKIYLEEYRTSLKKSEKYEEAKPKIYGALYGSLEECSQVKYERTRIGKDAKTITTHFSCTNWSRKCISGPDQRASRRTTKTRRWTTITI
jgi:hypothetical protein